MLLFVSSSLHNRVLPTYPGSGPGLFVSAEAVEEQRVRRFAWFGPHMAPAPTFCLLDPHVRLSVDSAAVECKRPKRGPEPLPPGNVRAGAADVLVVQKLTTGPEQVGHSGDDFPGRRDGA